MIFQKWQHPHQAIFIRIIKGNPKYSPYLPDNLKLENISKDLLFSVNNFLIFLVNSLHRARNIQKNVWTMQKQSGGKCIAEMARLFDWCDSGYGEWYKEIWTC